MNDSKLELGKTYRLPTGDFFFLEGLDENDGSVDDYKAGVVEAHGVRFDATTGNVYDSWRYADELQDRLPTPRVTKALEAFRSNR